MNPKHYRWIICLAGTLALFCSSGLLATGFNVYTPYLISVGGLTNAEVSVVLMVRNLFSLMSMFIVVPIIRKVDIRLNLTGASLIAAAALFCCSVAKNFAMFCAAMALSGLAYGLGGMVSVSVIIKRWFADHEGLALGICAAGTGLSSVIGSPIITAMIERRSMQYALRCETLFLVLMAGLLFLVVRNYPSKEKQAQVQAERQTKISARGQRETFHLSNGQKLCMFLGTLLCGMSYNASPFVTILFREKAFDAGAVGWMASFMGLTLCIGKCVYGAAADRLGRIRAGNLFYSFYVLGLVLCAACLPKSAVMAYGGLALLGMGFPMLSVGLSELAAGTAHEEYYADAVRQLQTAYMLGTVVFATVPGMMADWSGSYVPSYWVLALIALAAAILQQGVLIKKEHA